MLSLWKRSYYIWGLTTSPNSNCDVIATTWKFNRLAVNDEVGEFLSDLPTLLLILRQIKLLAELHVEHLHEHRGTACNTWPPTPPSGVHDARPYLHFTPGFLKAFWHLVVRLVLKFLARRLSLGFILQDVICEFQMSDVSSDHVIMNKNRSPTRAVEDWTPTLYRRDASKAETKQSNPSESLQGVDRIVTETCSLCRINTL